MGPRYRDPGLPVVRPTSADLNRPGAGSSSRSAVFSLLSHPHVGDPKPPASRSQSAPQVTSELLVADGVGIAVDFVPAQRGLRLALIGWSWRTSLQEVARQ
jgi:hypothetical protein